MNKKERYFYRNYKSEVKVNISGKTIKVINQLKYLTLKYLSNFLT